MTTTKPTPTGGLVVGETVTYVVGVQGEVTDRGEHTVTIGGFTLPTRLDGPVRYLSDRIPSADDSNVVEIDDPEFDDEQYDMLERQVDAVRDGIKILHDENHDGPLTVCMHEVCRRWWWGR